MVVFPLLAKAHNVLDLVLLLFKALLSGAARSTSFLS